MSSNQDVDGKFLPSKQFNQLVNQELNRYRDYEALKSENERLMNKVNNQQTANKHLRQERNLLNVALQEQKDHNAKLDKHIDWLSNRVDWLEKAFAVTKKALGRLRDRLKKLVLAENRTNQQTKIDAELTQLFQDDQVTDERLQAELRQRMRVAPEEKPKTVTREDEFYFDLPRDIGPSRGR